MKGDKHGLDRQVERLEMKIFNNAYDLAVAERFSRSGGPAHGLYGGLIEDIGRSSIGRESRRKIAAFYQLHLQEWNEMIICPEAINVELLLTGIAFPFRYDALVVGVEGEHIGEGYLLNLRMLHELCPYRIYFVK